VMHPAHQLVEINRSRRQCLLTREREQTLHQITTPARRLHDDLETSRLLGFLYQLRVQYFRIPTDRDQQIVEVVRDTRSQAADRGHGLCLTHPFLCLPSRRHVAVQRDEAAARQWVAAYLELASTWAGPLYCAHAGTGSQHFHPTGHFNIDV